MRGTNLFLRLLLVLLPLVLTVPAWANAPKAPDQSVSRQPAPIALEGITALSGRVLATDGTPLRGVLLRDGQASTLTDADGRFLLQGIAEADSVLVIDGRASRDRRAITDYGYYEARVHAEPHKTTVLPFTSYLPKIDHRHEVTIASPTTKPVVVTTPGIPGLELRIPAGMVLTDPDGKPVTKVGITPIPLDRTPFPLPHNVYVPIYFTAQPGGAVITAADGSWKGAQVVYPNYRHDLPKARGSFWRYDPDNLGWTIYGSGTVTSDGKQVVPDEHTQIYALTGAMFDGNSDGAPPGWAPPFPCAILPILCVPVNKIFGGNGSGGDPVDLASGLFVSIQTDLRLNDVVPLSLTRTYRPGDYNRRSFGIGTTLNYEMFLWSANQYQEVDLILPDSGRVHYTRIPNNPPSNGYSDAVFTTSSPTIFNQSHISWNGDGWNLVLQDGTLYVFGENAPLQYIQDRFGNRTTLTRQGGRNGHVSQVSSPNGRLIAFTYDSSDTVITQATDNAGRVVSYGYDASYRMTTVTDPDGGVTTYSWDGSNRISSIQDASGHTFNSNTYDANDRVTTQTLADGSTYQFAYTLDGTGTVIETDTTDPRGVVRKTTFDAAGAVATDRFAVGAPVEEDWSYTYQAGTELLLSRTDPLGRTTGLTYDPLGNLLTVTALSGTANAVTTQFTYGPFRALATITDPLSNTTTIQNNPLGQATSSTDSLGNQTSYTYDAEGRIATVTDPLGRTVSYTYDHGDLATITDPLLNVSTVFADAVGRVVRTTNALGQVTARAYDPIDGVKQVTDANGATTVYAFNPVGKLTSVTDARSGVTAFAYDTRNRLTTRTDPLLAVDSVTSYDPNGNLLTGQDRKGQVTTKTYDALNRLSTATYADGTSVSYTWDLGNRLTQIQDGVAGTITWGYDGLDRLTSEATALGTVQYTYDAASRLATKTIPGQATVTYTFDNASRLQSIAQGGATTSFTYDIASRLTATNLPNNIVEAYGLDLDGNVTSVTVTRLGTTLGTLTYSYDAANRISSRGGTLFQSVLPAAVTSASYDVADRLTQWVTPTGTTTPVWDANGNLTNDGLRSYSWDARDRLTAIPGVASFAYDAVGRRATATLAGTAQGYLYDGANAVQETTGGTVSANVMGGGGADSRFTRTVAGGGTSTYLTDILGSTVALADGTGTIQTSYGYDPYGNTAATGAANTNAYQFTGRENDGTGLYYYRARFYNPTWGRFISEDPIGLRGGINRYAYSGGDPVNFRDPSGNNPLGLILCALTHACGGSSSPTTPPQTKNANAADNGNAPGTDGAGGGAAAPDGGNQGEQTDAPVLPNFGFNDPGTPPTNPDGTPWEWRGPDDPGGARGGWVNPDNPDQSMHPDTDHGGTVGPHWDYTDRGTGTRIRIGPGGGISNK